LTTHGDLFKLAFMHEEAILIVAARCTDPATAQWLQGVAKGSRKSAEARLESAVETARLAGRDDQAAILREALEALRNAPIQETPTEERPARVPLHQLGGQRTRAAFVEGDLS
jgi:hypothetical protein